MATKIWTGAIDGDFNVAGNWNGGIPINADDVIFRDNAVSLTLNLNQAAITLASLTIEQSFLGEIGTAAAYLQIASTVVDLGVAAPFGSPGGSERIKLDLSGAQTTTTVHNSSRNSTDRYDHPIRLLLDTAGTVLRLIKGSVGVAEEPNETSTIPTLEVGYLDVQATDVDFSCGEAVTITTFTQTGGVAKLKSVPTTIVQYAGSLFVVGAAAITTATIYGGEFFPNNAGGITTLHPYGGTVDFTRSLVARTITNAPDFRAGGTVVLDPRVITLTAGFDADLPVTISASEAF